MTDLDKSLEDAHNAPMTNAPTTCPNHPTIAQALTVLIDRKTGAPYDNFSVCGCYRLADQVDFKRHSFRFFAGDRVQWGRFAGVTGTVADYSSDCSRPSITWDAHCKDWAPTSRPSNFDIRHIGEG